MRLLTIFIHCKCYSLLSHFFPLYPISIFSHHLLHLYSSGPLKVDVLIHLLDFERGFFPRLLDRIHFIILRMTLEGHRILLASLKTDPQFQIASSRCGLKKLGRHCVKPEKILMRYNYQDWNFWLSEDQTECCFPKCLYLDHHLYDQIMESLMPLIGCLYFICESLLATVEYSHICY